MATYTNSQINTAAAAVPAPYGPFTRVTDITTKPTPNDMVKIEFTDANGIHVFMTYEEVTNATLRNKIMSQVYGFQGKLHALINKVHTIDTALQAIKQTDANGYTKAQYDDAITQLRSIKEISGLL